MNISVICPHCQAKLKPKNALVPGKSVRCPGCKEQFLPEAEMPEADAYAVEPEEDRPTPELVLTRTSARGRTGEAVAKGGNTAEEKLDSGTAERPRKKKLAKKKEAVWEPPVREFVRLATSGATRAAGAIIAKRKQAASGPRGRWFSRLATLGAIVAAGATIFAVVKFVAKPSKPQWQRQLTAEDEKKAQQLMGRTLYLESEGKFAEALRPAEALAQLREQRQGADHWQARIPQDGGRHHRARARAIDRGAVGLCEHVRVNPASAGTRSQVARHSKRRCCWKKC